MTPKAMKANAAAAKQKPRTKAKWEDGPDMEEPGNAIQKSYGAKWMKYAEQQD